MSKRFREVNKYRNAVGHVAPKEQWYADIPVQTSSPSDKASLIQVSQTWMAVAWAASGGSIGLLPLDKPGKTCAHEARVFCAHSGSVSDWQFSDFDPDLLVTGGEDGMVKLWRVSGDSTCLSTLTTSSRRVDLVSFHPTANQIMTTLGNDGKKICIWDASKSAMALEIATPSEPFHSFSWKSDGSLLSTSAKGSIHVWDPRAGGDPQVSSGAGHEGIKGSRVVWLGDTNYLFSVGLNKLRNREYAVWDHRQLSKPVKKSSLDASTGLLLPMYDEDTETMYIVGRGDATIRSMQFSDLVSSAPSVTENMACATTASLYGATLMRKQTLDVMHAEIARVLAVVDHAVMPVSFQVPRKQYLDFHADLFPDTKGTVPALEAEDWLAGKNGTVQKVSLDPSKRKADAASTRQQVEVSEQQDTGRRQKEEPSEQVVTTQKQEEEKQLQQTSSTIEPAKEPILKDDTLKPQPKAHPSSYKYIAGKLYHPSTHYDDLRGLSIDKTGTFDLIQANARFIGVPIAGPGGRVGIIDSEEPGRLPTRIPCMTCGSAVTFFRFDPFNDHRLATASEDNKIRLWRIPSDGLQEDCSQPAAVLTDSSMDKIGAIHFHPSAQDVLMSVSQDSSSDSPTIRLWDLSKGQVQMQFSTNSQPVLSAAWSPDGQKIAIHAKDKQLRVFDARSGVLGCVVQSHEGIRPSRIVWLSEHRLATVGFGAGSMREILVYDIQDNAATMVGKKTIDVSPSVMSAHYDPDCGILYIAGRGDRIIHTYEALDNGQLEPLAKIECGSLQQGIAFLPKRLCHVRETEIARFYRLTPTTIEPYGVRVPRARPEYFQDDIFVDTADTEHSAQDAATWFAGESRPLRLMSLKPEDMLPLSQAPPPPQASRSKAKFEMGKKLVSDEERRKELMNRMFATAKEVDDEEERKRKEEKAAQEEKEVADEEWDE